MAGRVSLAERLGYKLVTNETDEGVSFTLYDERGDSMLTGTGPDAKNVSARVLKYVRARHPDEAKRHAQRSRARAAEPAKPTTEELGQELRERAETLDKEIAELRPRVDAMEAEAAACRQAADLLLRAPADVVQPPG